MDDKSPAAEQPAPQPQKAKRKLPWTRIIITTLAAAAIIAWIAWPSKKAPERFVPNVTDAPTMSTTDVSTLISDSGYTKYRITTPLWQMFEESQDPYWLFPQGLELEQYDHNLKPQAGIVCDTATYFSSRRLWKLSGNVVMVNTQRDSFLTQQLYWDQNMHKLYSDSFIHIVRADYIIEGYGFESSDQNMRFYSINRPTAILPPHRKKDEKSPISAAPKANASPVQQAIANSASQDASYDKPHSQRLQRQPVK